MSRTIKVNTDDLWDAALRYERLAFTAEDIVAGINTIRAQLISTDLIHGVDNISRKADDLVYRIHSLGGKLRFAASKYEDFHRRVILELEDEN